MRKSWGKYIKEGTKTEIEYTSCPKCGESINLKVTKILSKQERIDKIIKKIGEQFNEKSSVYNNYVYELIEESGFVYIASINMDSKIKMKFPIIIYEVKKERYSQNGCELNINTLEEIIKFFKDYYGTTDKRAIL